MEAIEEIRDQTEQRIPRQHTIRKILTMPNIHFYIPRSLLSIVGGITAIAPYLADWNETHIYNPNWPGMQSNA